MGDKLEHIAPLPALGADTATDANITMAQQAMTFYQCKDGSLVRDPKACTTPVGELPKLSITG